jgi:DMSO/TMAO reductase YedYZ molybdopterin-dependent catalytic subunit
MTSKSKPPGKAARRHFLGAAAALALAGCEPRSDRPWVRSVIGFAEDATRRAQRALMPRSALAREYSEADISRQFRANGTFNPGEPAYQALAARGFAGWRLELGGLVEQPLELSLAELRALPARTQITRHDCVEGWSCIGKWKGVPLGTLLERARLQPAARYIVFHCMDRLEEPGPYYYESIDLVDAFHPQTLLAYEMNGEVLPVAHGAPLRLRVERQLGYKMAKYVTRIEAVASFADLGAGKGGYWEDLGYEWYAGI